MENLKEGPQQLASQVMNQSAREVTGTAMTRTGASSVTATKLVEPARMAEAVARMKTGMIRNLTAVEPSQDLAAGEDKEKLF